VKGLLIGRLRAVIWKRLAGDLPPGQPPSVSEGGQVYRVHGPALVQEVEHAVGAFVHERHGAHLDADGLAFGRWFGRSHRAKAG
jgi:hypothetical protein